MMPEAFRNILRSILARLTWNWRFLWISFRNIWVLYFELSNAITIDTFSFFYLDLHFFLMLTTKLSWPLSWLNSILWSWFIWSIIHLNSRHRLSNYLSYIILMLWAMRLRILILGSFLEEVFFRLSCNYVLGKFIHLQDYK